MRIKSSLTALSLSLLALACQPVGAQSTLWQTFFNEAFADYQKGDLSGAEKSFESALSQAQSFGEADQRYYKSMEGLALVYSRQGKYKDADNLYQKIIGIKEKALGSDSPEVALTMGNMADLYQTEGKYSAAEVLYKSSLNGLQKGSVPYLEKLQNLAVCYTQDGNYKQAEDLLQQAIKLENIIFGAGSSQLAMTTLNLANLYVKRGDYELAEASANQVLAIQKNAEPSDATANSAINVLAIVNLRLGNYTKADEYARKNLGNNEAANAPDSVAVGKSLHNLAHLLRAERKYSEAQKLLEKAREIFEQNNDPSLADTLAELGELNVDQGKYSDGEEFYKRAQALREKMYGANHPDIGESLAQLAYVYAQRNDFDAAEAAYKRALTIYKNTIGEKHPDYAKTLANLGLLYAQKHDNNNAEKYLSQAVAAREKILPADHLDLILSLNQLAGFYRDSGSPAQAEPLYRRLLALDTAGLAATGQAGQAGQARQASDLDNLADVLTAQNKTSEAQSLQNQAQTLKKSLPGAASASTATFPQEAGVRATSAKPVSEKWCLCIGISNFKDSEINLKYAAKDATDFAKFMSASGNFKTDHVKLLVDKDATRDNIIDQLGDKWLGHEAKADDLVIIYISSHGSTALQEANNTNFLVAYDTNKNSLLASGIPMQWLSQIIKEQVHSNRVLLILDVCHSGSAAEATTGNSAAQSATSATSAKPAPDSKGLTRLPNMNVSQLPIGLGQIVLCSSAADQVSWESKEYPNSVFTKRLIEALQSSGQNTTLSQAYKVMRDKVEEEVLRDRGQMQTPVVKSTWQGADLAPLSASPK